MKRTSSFARGRQRGVATLVVVMVLFFIISLVAAYTNRNLIFEQRTSVNQYRATQALEAADAGLEWTVAMLNGGLITSACVRSTSLADTSFRRRYVNIDGVTGNMTPMDATVRAGCVWNGSGWQCNCPISGLPTLTAPTTGGIFPAFRVRFETALPTPAPTGPPLQPGVIRVLVSACTRLDDACLSDTNQGAQGEGHVTVSALVAITGNLASPPVAALVARGAVNLGGTQPLAVYNATPAGTGITIQAGGDVIQGGMVLGGLSGSPVDQSIRRFDSALSTLDALGSFSANDRMFAGPFNMTLNTFQQQPAAVVLPCAGGSCSAADVRNAIALNPGRPLWLQGGLTVDSAGDIGSSTEPALLVVNGHVSFPTSGVTIFGLVYVRNNAWSVSGSGRIRGGVMADGAITAPAGATLMPTIVFDPDVLGRLHNTVGSLVRVPGSWKDFQ